MNEAQAMFALLRQSADAAAEAIEELVREAPDHNLVRINALDFAAKGGPAGGGSLRRA